MTYGNIRSPLLKVTNGIAARGHNIAQQPIRFRHCTRWAVDKAQLNPAPELSEARAIGYG